MMDESTHFSIVIEGSVHPDWIRDLIIKNSIYNANQVHVFERDIDEELETLVDLHQRSDYFDLVLELVDDYRLSASLPSSEETGDKNE